MKPLLSTVKVWFDEHDVRERALQAMRRARIAVHPVPVTGATGFYTLSTEVEPMPDGVLSRADAERYAAAINGEADLARAMLLVLSELDALKEELAKAKSPPGA